MSRTAVLDDLASYGLVDRPTTSNCCIHALKAPKKGHSRPAIASEPARLSTVLRPAGRCSGGSRVFRLIPLRACMPGCWFCLLHGFPGW